MCLMCFRHSSVLVDSVFIASFCQKPVFLYLVKDASGESVLLLLATHFFYCQVNNYNISIAY